MKINITAKGFQAEVSLTAEECVTTIKGLGIDGMIKLFQDAMTIKVESLSAPVEPTQAIELDQPTKNRKSRVRVKKAKVEVEPEPTTMNRKSRVRVKKAKVEVEPEPTPEPTPESIPEAVEDEDETEDQDTYSCAMQYKIGSPIRQEHGETIEYEDDTIYSYCPDQALPVKLLEKWTNIAKEATKAIYTDMEDKARAILTRYMNEAVREQVKTLWKSKETEKLAKKSTLWTTSTPEEATAFTNTLVEGMYRLLMVLTNESLTKLWIDDVKANEKIQNRVLSESEQIDCLFYHITRSFAGKSIFGQVF